MAVSMSSMRESKSYQWKFSLRGLSKTCGCGVRAKTQERNDAKTIDETGHRYGMLTVISRNYEAKGRAMWNCHCDCGQDCVVSGKLLRSGWTKSCGCLQSKGELKVQQLLNALGLICPDCFGIFLDVYGALS